MRVLFVALPDRGHLNPLLAIARRLLDQGHDVAFFAHADVTADLEAARVSAPVYGPKAPRAKRAGAARDDDEAWLARYYQIATATVLTEAMIDAVHRTIDDFRPDVLAIDPLAYHGVAVAEARDLPWAGLSTNFTSASRVDWSSPSRRAYARIDAWRADLFATHGVRLPTKYNEILSPWLRVAFATEAFLRDAEPQFHLVGPARRTSEATGAFPWQELSSERRRLYVSPGGSGTRGVAGEAFRRVLEALVDVDAQLVVVGSRAAMPTLAPDAIVVDHAPQLALLARVDAVVTAGGANTVGESLAHGRPMLVVPFVNDQPLQAILVERAGVGVGCAPADVERDVVRHVTAILEEEGPMRNEASAIAADYAARDGAAEAARLVLELGGRRTPMLPS